MSTCFISAKSESVRVFDSPTLILAIMITMRVVMIMMMILIMMMVMVMGMKYCPL